MPDTRLASRARAAARGRVSSARRRAEHEAIRAARRPGLQAVPGGIAEMAPQDRAVHVMVTAAAPGLSPTWYCMPVYANAAGNVVVLFQDAGKFSYRYPTLGSPDAPNLDGGGL